MDASFTTAVLTIVEPHLADPSTPLRRRRCSTCPRHASYDGNAASRTFGFAILGAGRRAVTASRLCPGPETLTRNIVEAGLTYCVGVHYWDDKDFGLSVATVRIVVDNTLAFEASESLQARDMWEVACLGSTADSITPSNVCEGTSDRCVTAAACGQAACVQAVLPNYENPSAMLGQ
jgi:hypothetical protein